MSLPPIKKISLPPLSKTSLSTKETSTNSKSPKNVKSKKLPKLSPPKLVKSPTKKSVAKKKSTTKSVSKSPRKLPPKPKKSVTKTKTKKDLTKHLNTFFPVRNKIKPKPVEGKNYTNETLTYMTPKVRADETTKIIVDKMKELDIIPFGIFEVGAGMGGNTLSFLDNKDISYVVSYEINPERRQMLINNISMYDLSDKSFVPEDEFNGVPETYQNVVLYFDPPWLPSEIKGDESSKSDYLLSGIKMSGKTLEDWIKECKNCALVGLKVPPGYKLESLPNHNVEILNLRKSDLIIITPKEKPIIKEFIETVDQDYLEWRNNLKTYLRDDLLAKILPNPELREKMVSDEAMEIWEVAFTHESFNPNIGENYEEMELYGDRVMGVNFLKYMMQRFPTITRSQLSELRTNYLAKKFQSDLSQSLGLGNYVRTRFKKSTHVFEDVLESFFGALDLVGDKVFKFGAGMGLAYNMVMNIFKDVEIDWVLTKGNPKTRIKELYEGLGWTNPKEGEKVPEEADEDDEGNVTFTITITNRGMEHLRELGVPITTSVISRETDTTKKKASDKAYKKAVENFERLGIDDEWVARVKGNRDFNNPELIGYVAAARNRILQEGFEDFYFNEYHVKSKTGKRGTDKYVQLIGIRPNGRKEVVIMTETPVEDLLEGKKELLSDYAR